MKHKTADFIASVLGVSSVGFIVVFLICIGGVIGMFCWPYTINSWLVFLDKEAMIVWWQGFLLGMVPVFGKFAIPGAIVTWILMMFLT